MLDYFMYDHKIIDPQFLFFFITESVPVLLGRTNPYRPRESRVNPKCGSAVSNSQPPGTNYGPKPTELPHL